MSGSIRDVDILLWIEMVDVDRGGRNIGVSPVGERIHPVAVQPKKAPCKLPKIVPIGTDWKSPRSPQCVRSLLFQW